MPNDEDLILDIEPLISSANLPRQSVDFQKAGEETKALLVVQREGSDTSFLAKHSDPHGHAEHNLLADPTWNELLDQARDAALDKDPIATTFNLIINRTPCHGVLCDCRGKPLSREEGARYSIGDIRNGNFDS